MPLYDNYAMCVFMIGEDAVVEILQVDHKQEMRQVLTYNRSRNERKFIDERSVRMFTQLLYLGQL